MKPRSLLSVFFCFAVACGGEIPNANVPVDLPTLRDRAKGSSDADLVGRLLLDEMLAPGGTARGAADAYATMAKKKSELIRSDFYGPLGRALYAEVHGDPKSAADDYVRALSSTVESSDPAAPLAAWFATHHLSGLRGSVANLWDKKKDTLNALMKSPGNIGWRALAELHEWSTAEAFDKAEVTGAAYDALVTDRMGCATIARIAGPFGRGTSPDRRRAFAAERAPWPPSWPEDPSRGSVAHILKTERHRCITSSTEKTEEGVFYVETFFDSPKERDLLVAVQGSVAVWVDDTLVVERDLRNWGVWQRFGGAVRVSAGRHRVLARVLNDASSIRLMNLDGTAARIVTDIDDKRPYGLTRPTLLGDPNPANGVVNALARGQKVALTPLMTALVAHAAHVDGLDDVAATLLDTLASPKDAAPVALLMAAQYAHADVAYPEQLRHNTEKALYGRAAAGDEKLWYARGWLVLDAAEQRGLVEAVEPLRAVAKDYAAVPELTEQLARVYGRLGWRAERMRTVRDLAERFPDDRDALQLYISSLEEDGSFADADRLAVRLKQLDPDAEVDLDRALARRDWTAAIAELKRLEKRRPDRKEIAARIAGVLMRAGDPSAAAEQLRKALVKNPDDAGLRLKLADYAFAKGDTTALRRALAEALQSGSKGAEIRDAVETIEGASLLEPYRVDGRKVIREFEAWEKSGKHMEGTAARVLDYAATWVHADGSSEMLEHEIIRMQSEEAVSNEAEQQPPGGLVLRLRVIKPDGSILEPEPVAGKPTLTMPHLGVGDYLEIEHITTSPSDGGKGRRYRGPHWFFREADKGYWRSEFVVVAPKDRPLEIESVGKVPTPTIREKGLFTERKWRVDESPPAPEEPDSPNPREFLPSVRVGWGVNLADTLVRYVDAAAEETPLDPRIMKIANEIVGKIPRANKDDRARAIYRYLAEQIQEGNESDGRRVITGRSGSRQSAFMYFARLLGIPVELALVKNRIAMPPRGNMSEVEVYDNLVARLETEKGPRWLTVRDKFAPFGYVPAELRGQPAIRLVAGTPRDTTPSLGTLDGVLLEGKAVLREDGGASVVLSQSYLGKMGMGLRAVFDRVPEGKRNEFVETRLLGANLPGARLRSLTLENAQDLGAPLVVKMTADVPQMARVQGGKLVLKAVFPVSLAQIASLAERQTPLLLATSSHVEVNLAIEVPKSVRLPESLPGGALKDGDRTVTVSDDVATHLLHLKRVVDIPAGRIQPGDEYARFVAFMREADRMLEREIPLSN